MKIINKAKLLYAQGPVEIITSAYTVARDSLDLVVSSTAYDVGTKAWSYSLEVVYDGTWEAESDSDWLTLSPYGKRFLEFTVALNDTGKARTGKITITPSEGDAVTVSVEQAASDPITFGTEPATLAIPAAGGRVPFVLYCPDYWTDHVNANWATLEQKPDASQEVYTGIGSGYGMHLLYVNAEKNESTLKRSSTIVFSYKKKRFSLVLEQEAAEAPTDPVS